jgi:hypothetical protein
VPQKAGVVKLPQQIQVQPHQLGQEVFKTILPDDIDWKPFPAFPLPSGWPSLWVSPPSPALTPSESKRPTTPGSCLTSTPRIASTP